MNSFYMAKPLSRKEIEDVSWLLRATVGLNERLEFPVVFFLENIMPSLYKGFDYEYPPIEEMNDKHGATLPDENKILIREDIYKRACAGAGRDRFTIAHEIGHYILHDSRSIVLTRMAPNVKIPAYRDLEWQANAFGGALLMPRKLIRGLSVSQVADECKVSLQAAKYQLDIFKRTK